MPESALRMELERAASGLNLNNVRSRVKHFFLECPRSCYSRFTDTFSVLGCRERALPIAMRLGRKGRVAA